MHGMLASLQPAGGTCVSCQLAQSGGARGGGGSVVVFQGVHGGVLRLSDQLLCGCSSSGSQGLAVVCRFSSTPLNATMSSEAPACTHTCEGGQPCSTMMSPFMQV